jgi:hypothetical protein
MKKVVTYHEAGHAVVARVLGSFDKSNVLIRQHAPPASGCFTGGQVRSIRAPKQSWTA